MDQTRRAFIKNAALASSALAAAGKLSAQGGGTNFQRIAAEETFAIPEFLDAIREYVRQDPDRQPSPVTPLEDAMANALTDLGAGRIATMDAARIDKQILALWSPGVQIFNPQLGRELASLVNDRLAEAIRQYPDRFAGLVTVATQDPASAAQEAERGISTLGLNGILINSHTNNEFLDERKYWPILEAAESLDVPVYLHPRIPPDQIYQGVADYNMEGPLWGFGMETSMHVVRLLMSDVFEQFPNLKIVLGHLGEGIPFWLSRLDVISSTRPGMPATARRPSEYFMDNFAVVTSAMFWDPVFMFVHSVLGPERIMFGVDYPFAPSTPGTTWMDATPISDADKRMIYQENAERIFSL